MLYADKDGIETLKDTARTVSGIKIAENDERIKLNKENEKKLKSRLDNSKGELQTICIQVYSKIAYPSGAEPRLDQISTMDTKQNNLTGMVIELLKNKGKLLDPQKELNHDIIKFEKTAEIAKILENFKIDKSKHFILENQQIFNAVKVGIQQGVFGYSGELVEKDGKYVGKIKEYVEPSWTGFLIAKELVLSTKAKIEEEPEPELPSNFRYKINATDIEKTLEVLSQLTILSLDAKMDKTFQTTLQFEDTTISISSKLTKSDEIKSLLNSLKSKGYSGEGILTISSDIDLQNDFKKWDTTFEVI